MSSINAGSLQLSGLLAGSFQRNPCYKGQEKRAGYAKGNFVEKSFDRDRLIPEKPCSPYLCMLSSAWSRSIAIRSWITFRCCTESRTLPNGFRKLLPTEKAFKSAQKEKIQKCCILLGNAWDYQWMRGIIKLLRSCFFEKRDVESSSKQRRLVQPAGSLTHVVLEVLKLLSRTAPRERTRFKGIDARFTTHLHASITSIVSVEPDRVQKISLLFSFTVSFL